MPKYDVWVRHVMDAATYKLISERLPAALDVVEVSGDAWRDIFEWKSYAATSYPAFDICQSSFDKSYDLIIAEQVFEHIRYPARAAKNIFDSLRPDGYALITVPCMFHLHPTPLDCWRWTPQGLSFLFEDAGFERSRIMTDSWGNVECFVQHAKDTSVAPAYTPDLSLINQSHVPIVVWGLAQKS